MGADTLETIKKYKHIILILLPLFLGWLINNSIFILNIYGNLIWIFSISFVVYWFWVGKQFGQLRYHRLVSLLIGNAIWIISFGLYIWQFVFVNEMSRNMFLAVISQHYGLFTITFATRIVMLFDNDVIDSTQVLIVSYILMVVIFTIGFIYESIRWSRMIRNKEKTQ